MMGYQIFSDGSCDLSDARKKQYDIKTIPFYVSFDGETYYKELEELSLKTYFRKMNEDKCFPKTSLPSVDDYCSAFAPDLEDGKDILCFCICTALSGSLQSAMTAKNILQEQYPDQKIIIISSWQATGSQALLAMEAAKMKTAGYTVEQTAAACEELKKSCRIFFTLDTLEYLQKGGRIGKIASVSGALLNVKPNIVLRDDAIHLAGISRGKKKSIKKITELAKEYLNQSGLGPSGHILLVGSGSIKEDRIQLTQILREELPDAEILDPFEIGATICSHTGPEALGICITRKFTTLESLS